MSQVRCIPFELQTAFEVFFRELGGHIDFLQSLLSDIEQLSAEAGEAEILKDQSERAGKRLHLIRGGASFLGLKDLQDVASRGEDFCESLDFGQRANPEITQELEQLIEQLRAEENSLASYLPR